VVLFRTVISDIADLKNVFYDIIVFFSPSSVQSLYENFPDFVQNDTRIAAFGTTTQQALLDKGLILDIPAPMPNAPSMTMAVEQYIKQVNK
jgi:uroporphyrinogen-III synthase